MMKFPRSLYCSFLLITLLITACQNPTITEEPVPIKTKLSSITVSANGGNLQLSPAFSEDTLEYTVSAPHAVTEITISAVPIEADSTITISPAQPALLEIGNNFFTIQVQNGSQTRVYRVNAIHTSNTQKEITAFTFANPTATGIISGTQVNIPVPHGTNLTALVPTITHTGQGISPASGVAQDFTEPVEYTVTAIDGSIKTYTVTVIAGSVVTVNNTGEYAADMIVYTGKYSSVPAQRIVVDSLTIKAGETGAIISTNSVNNNNVWLQMTSGTKAGSTYYLTCNGRYALFKLFPDNQYTITFERDSDYGSPSYTITYTGSHSPLDWDLSDNPVTTSYGSFESLKSGNLSGLKVNLLDSPDWALDTDGAYIVKSSESATAQYIYGIIRLVYQGNTTKTLIKGNMRLRNQANTIRYFDATYAKGLFLVSPTSDSTYDSCVVNQGDIIRFKLIENIKDHNVLFSDLNEIDIFISDNSSNNLIPQENGLVISGASIETQSYLDTPVTNTTLKPVQSLFSVGFFTDSGNREYFWTYGSVYMQDSVSKQWDYSSEPIPSLASARIRTTKPYNPNFSETYTLELNIDWDYSTVNTQIFLRNIINPALEPQLTQRQSPHEIMEKQSQEIEMIERQARDLRNQENPADFQCSLR